MPVHLRAARELGELPGTIVREWRDEIERLLPGAEVLHSGGTSLPDALTRGDVDLHVRFEPKLFGRAAAVLSERFVPYLPGIWEPGFAAFVVEEESRLPTGIALTANGGRHDRRFARAWELLRERPDLLAAHNDLKRRFEGTTDETAYRAAKSAFFDRLVAA